MATAERLELIVWRGVGYSGNILFFVFMAMSHFFMSSDDGLERVNGGYYGLLKGAGGFLNEWIVAGDFQPDFTMVSIGVAFGSEEKHDFRSHDIVSDGIKFSHFIMDKCFQWLPCCEAQRLYY